MLGQLLLAHQALFPRTEDGGLDDLDEESLLTILTETKNALSKQYTKLFAIEGIRLIIARDALREVAKIAFRKKTGARGLRTVLESILMPVMFETPSRNDIKEIMITRDVILKKAEPLFTLKKDKKMA